VISRNIDPHKSTGELFVGKEGELEEVLGEESPSEAQKTVKAKGRKPKTSVKQGGKEAGKSTTKGKSRKGRDNSSGAHGKKGTNAADGEQQTSIASYFFSFPEFLKLTKISVSNCRRN
jgi:hypothetical protein